MKINCYRANLKVGWPPAADKNYDLQSYRGVSLHKKTDLVSYRDLPESLRGTVLEP